MAEGGGVWRKVEARGGKLMYSEGLEWWYSVV